jgi:ComF family protein
MIFLGFKNFFVEIVDFLLPLRSDFKIVKSLDEESIINLPKAPEVFGLYWIYSLFHYKNRKVKAIIWELKYREVTLPLNVIGRLLYEEIILCISDIVLFDSDAKFVLIPIPISQSRRTERGFNQSEHIAKSILENDLERILLYAPQWFEKIKETPRQSHSMSKDERIKNLKDSFRANLQVEGKYIILIDDVVTTGSTLVEARKVLLEKGAKDVKAFTIAH